MTTTYTHTQLLQERDNLTSKINELSQKKVAELDKKVIDISTFRAINSQQLTLENCLNELNIKLITRTFSSISVDDDSPGANLRAAIQNLGQAISNLAALKVFLTTVSEVITAVGQVIDTIGRMAVKP